MNLLLVIFFAKMNLAGHAIAVYKNDTHTVLINEYYNRATNKNCKLLNRKEWSKVVADTDTMNNASSLAYLLEKYFDTCFFQDNNNN